MIRVYHRLGKHSGVSGGPVVAIIMLIASLMLALLMVAVVALAYVGLALIVLVGALVGSRKHPEQGGFTTQAKARWSALSRRLEA